MGCQQSTVSDPRLKDLEEKKDDGYVEAEPMIIEIFKNEEKRTRDIKKDRKLIAQIIKARDSAKKGDNSRLEKIRKREKELKVQQNSDVLERIWAKYDSNSNGLLEMEEIENLLKAYIVSAKEWISGTIIAAAMRGFINQIEGGELEFHDVSKVNELLKDEAKKIMDDWERRKREGAAKRMKATMDVDDDGSVEKAEFMKKFLAALENDVLCASDTRMLAKKVTLAASRAIANVMAKDEDEGGDSEFEGDGVEVVYQA